MELPIIIIYPSIPYDYIGTFRVHPSLNTTKAGRMNDLRSTLEDQV